eukprot:m.122444 g.122444  ORF g.122444 m.122444 type:complete len:135 (-) comp15652_c0_seq3:1905-2309(-)
MPGMEGLAGMMQDPAVASLMSNPQMMQSMMPQIQQLMSNPEALQSMMSAFGGGSGGPSPFANNPNLSSQMAAAAQQLQSNPDMMQNIASAMSSGNPGEVARSVDADKQHIYLVLSSNCSLDVLCADQSKSKKMP